MRLASKIFLANSLVILVLVGVEVWTLVEVARLLTADRQIVVRTADALRLEASLRERVAEAHRLEMRAIVFADREYVAVPSYEAFRIQQGLELLGTFLAGEAELGAWRRGIDAFARYRAAVARSREARAQGDREQAARVLDSEGQASNGELIAALDQLTDLTQAALNQSQLQASATLGQFQSGVAQLRSRTWQAVIVALAVALLAALAGTALIAHSMTRSLRRLAGATTSLAQGAFEPVPVDSADEIGALARSFNNMAARLREVDAIKEQFYATMSHELRSPLTSAREAAHVLQQGGPGPLTEKQEKLVGIIHQSAERLLRLVSQVLDLSRLSAGLLPIERTWIDLDRVARRAVKEMRVQAKERGVTLTYDRESGPIDMFGDEDRIVEVLVNLLANGIRFTPPDGTVTLRILDAGADLELQVEDTGAGIPADKLPVLFERYRQAHSGHGGTGLGLAIVRGLVEAHGGRVAVESTEGRGSRFTVFLPRKAGDAAELGASVRA
jgi:signal transduction histidine kinase